MADDGEELFSAKIAAGKRTYFFDVKRSREGVRYLVLSEAQRAGTRYEHGRVMIFEEHLKAFIRAFHDALQSLNVEGAPAGGDSPEQPAKAYDVEEIRLRHAR